VKGNQPRARTGCWFPSHRLPSKPSRSAKQLGSRCRGPAESRRSQAALPSLLRLRPQPKSAFVAIRTVQHYASVVDKALSDPARKRALTTTMRPAPLHLACFFAAFTSSPPPDAHEFRGNRGAESSLCVSTAPRAILYSACAAIFSRAPTGAGDCVARCDTILRWVLTTAAGPPVRWFIISTVRSLRHETDTESTGHVTHSLTHSRLTHSQQAHPSHTPT
jgi:hypothetical protein